MLIYIIAALLVCCVILFGVIWGQQKEISALAQYSGEKSQIIDDLRDHIVGIQETMNQIADEIQDEDFLDQIEYHEPTYGTLH